MEPPTVADDAPRKIYLVSRDGSCPLFCHFYTKPEPATPYHSVLRHVRVLNNSSMQGTLRRLSLFFISHTLADSHLQILGCPHQESIARCLHCRLELFSMPAADPSPLSLFLSRLHPLVFSRLAE